MATKRGASKLAVIFVVITAIVALTVGCASTTTKTTTKKKAVKKLPQSTLVGYWYEPSDELDEGEELYYAFRDDGTYSYYDMSNGAVVTAVYNGDYACTDGKITMSGTIQFFQKDESGHDTIDSGPIKELYKCKSWTNDTLKFVEQATSSPDKMTLKRLDTDDKIKDAENKRLDNIDRIDAQITQETGETAY